MESARKIRQAILAARKNWGTTLIIASHNKSWLTDICDKILYLYNGRLLDYGYENILPGPWQQVDSRLYCTYLADQQLFYVSQPPTPESSAIIDPGLFELSECEPSDAEKVLHGTVSGIFFDKLQAGPRINVVCGDHRFTATVEDSVFSVPGLRPGRKVTLLYRPEQITWLAE